MPPDSSCDIAYWGALRKAAPLPHHLIVTDRCGSSSADHSAVITVSNAGESWRQDLDVSHGSWPTLIFDCSSVEAGLEPSAATGSLRHATGAPARELAPKSGEHFGPVALPRGSR